MSYQSEVLADSPALYLPLTEASGASCADLSTNGFVGTAHGTFTRGVSLGAGVAGVSPGVTLNGTTADYIDVPSAAALNITADVTYEAWVIPLSLSGTLFTILSKGYQADNTTQGYYFLVNNNTSTNALQFTPCFDGTTLALTGNNVVALSTLAHVVVTRTAANLTTIYVNGTQAAQQTVAASIHANNVPFSIGVLQSGSGGGSFARPFKMTVASVAIYPTALSSTRVSAHYAARNIPPAAPVSGYSYQFAA